MRARFIMSAGTCAELPQPQGDEYAIFGRSNVGKSSFINHAFENNTLARVSKTPGKTTCANYYKITESMYWVDLPGYGYAKTSFAEKKRWSQLVGEYCKKRQNLKGALWLLDIRHVGIRTDNDAWVWIHDLHIPVFPILTKGDKIPRSKSASHVRAFTQFYNFSTSPLVYSIKNESSRREFWQRFTAWIQTL